LFGSAPREILAILGAQTMVECEGQMRVATLLVALLWGAGLAACNTMAGLGKDIEKGGQKIEDAATKKK
jgi:predicted small secreted protein